MSGTVNCWERSSCPFCPFVLQILYRALATPLLRPESLPEAGLSAYLRRTSGPCMPFTCFSKGTDTAEIRPNKKKLIQGREWRAPEAPQRSFFSPRPAPAIFKICTGPCLHDRAGPAHGSAQAWVPLCAQALHFLASRFCLLYRCPRAHSSPGNLVPGMNKRKNKGIIRLKYLAVGQDAKQSPAQGLTPGQLGFLPAVRERMRFSPQSHCSPPTRDSNRKHSVLSHQ